MSTTLTHAPLPTAGDVRAIRACIEEALERLAALPPHQERTHVGGLLLEAREVVQGWEEAGGYRP